MQAMDIGIPARLVNGLVQPETCYLTVAIFRA
jgi:hypothetical protein